MGLLNISVEDFELSKHAKKKKLMGTSYLHEQVSTPTPSEVTLTYRPRADCAYTQLISRIKGAQQLHKEQQGYGKEVEDNSLQQQPQQSDATGGALTVEQQQQYFQYYYTLRYYDGYKVLGEQYTAQGLDPQLLLQNISIQEQIQQQAVQYAQAALTAYMAQFTNTTLPITIVPSAQVSPADQTPTLIAIGQTVVPGTQAKEVESTAPVAKALNPLLTLAHYGSDSDEEIEDCDNGEGNRENNNTAESKSSNFSNNQCKFEAYLIPPEDVSVIIDKMAAYVSKNGADFENIVRNRGDPRFEFLKAGHEFHSYYKLKLKEYLGPSAQDNENISAKNITQDTSTCEASTAIEQQKGSTTTKENDTIEKKLPVPVSFSIKIREESQIEIKLSALPIEESSDEEEHDITINNDNQKQLDLSANGQNDFDCNQTLKSSNSCIKNSIITKEVTILNSKSRHLVDSKIVKGAVIDITETGKKNDDIKKRWEKKGMEFSDDDPLLEMIDLTDDFDDKNENSTKQLKSSHDQQQRALQLERRRKAAAFLRLRSIMEQGKAVENQTDSKAIATDTHQTSIIASGNLTRKGINTSRDGTAGKEEEGGQCMSSDVVEIIDDSEEDGAETKKDKERKKSSRRRKSHKRKHSSQHKSSRSHRDGSSSSSSRHKNKKRKKVISSEGKSKRPLRTSRSRTRSSSRSS